MPHPKCIGRKKNYKKTQYGTKNLSKGAKSRVRVLADIQNFALRVHCVRTACMAFPINKRRPQNGRGGAVMK